MKRIRVALGIQARRSSSRLPDKTVKKLVGSTTLIDSLIDNCLFCANHVRKKSTPMQSIGCDVVILVPDEEKEFWENFLRAKAVQIATGSRDSVVERYLGISNYDYIVRLTSDCPNVPPITINKLIFTAMHYDLDYLSNSWEDFRTAIDGHDCEIMSRKAMTWLRKMNLSKSQQEHVTLAIREQRPESLKLGALISKEDLSHLKLCIDTQDEYDNAVERFSSAAHKRNIATEKGVYHYDY